MQNTKILEMIDNGQIAELKALIQDEIFTDKLKKKSGAKQRYAAMKKYFSYTKDNENRACTMPCIIDFKGEKYTSFINGYSIALTTETSGEIRLFRDPDKYVNVERKITFDGDKKEIDFNKIIAEAKSKGYKLKKSEVDPASENFKYILHYDDAYFKIGLLDATYSIINDGKTATVWHPGKRKKSSPIIIKNSLGVCVVYPFRYENEKYGVTVIEIT